MKLCIDMNSELMWYIDDFLILPHHTESDLSLHYYEYKIKSSDTEFHQWLCQSQRDILIYLEDSNEKYHELSGCSGIKESDELVSVKIWFYRTGIKNMTPDRIKLIDSKVLSYKRSQILNKLDI